MATRLQLRKGTTTEHSTFVGANGEVTVDTSKKALVLHDGVTAGGIIVPYTVNGVVEYSMLPDELLYTPIPYPKSSPPLGYLAMMGQAISAATYPKLFALYGATLPDLRGQFLRGLDCGRGIDTARVVLSEQQDEIKAHSHTAPIIGTTPVVAAAGSWSERGVNSSSSGSSGSTGGTETRPKNIAFLYIVKAG